MAQQHKNFAYSTIATAPSPATTGTSLVVAAGQGDLFPVVPFNVTIWPTGEQPTSTNAEIVRVTAVDSDTFTIVRQEESTSARTIVVGDQIAATITKTTIDDIQTIASTLTPMALSSSGTGLQTLNNATGSSGTGSMLMFPVTVPANLQFNQILVPNSLTWVSSANANNKSNSYYSKFGLYSMNANTLSLISSNSFSIGETLSGSRSFSWNYPTTTQTAGYGYGGFPGGTSLTTTAQFGSYVGGMRVIGLQFGGNISLTPNVYWVGVLSLRSTANTSTVGLSHAGIFGQAIHTLNQVGTSSTNQGIMPIGQHYSQWSISRSHVTGWWGRHIIGFLTATSVTNFLGTAVPSAVTLSQIGGFEANSTVTLLPAVTFAST